MKKLFLIVALTALPLAGISKKSVTGSVEIVPNYLWHMFASSNLWDKLQNPYGERYGHIIPQTDRQFLYDHRELIAWDNSGRNVGRRDIFVPLQSETTIENYIASL